MRFIYINDLKTFFFTDYKRWNDMGSNYDVTICSANVLKCKFITYQSPLQKCKCSFLTELFRLTIYAVTNACRAMQ